MSELDDMIVGLSLNIAENSETILRLTSQLDGLPEDIKPLVEKEIAYRRECVRSQEMQIKAMTEK